MRRSSYFDGAHGDWPALRPVVRAVIAAGGADTGGHSGGRRPSRRAEAGARRPRRSPSRSRSRPPKPAGHTGAGEWLRGPAARLLHHRVQLVRQQPARFGGDQPSGDPSAGRRYRHVRRPDHGRDRQRSNGAAVPVRGRSSTSRTCGRTSSPRTRSATARAHRRTSIVWAGGQSSSESSAYNCMSHVTGNYLVIRNPASNYAVVAGSAVGEQHVPPAVRQRGRDDGAAHRSPRRRKPRRSSPQPKPPTAPPQPAPQPATTVGRQRVERRIERRLGSRTTADTVVITGDHDGTTTTHRRIDRRARPVERARQFCRHCANSGSRSRRR